MGAICQNYGTSGYTFDESGVYEREYLYDDYSGRELVTIRYAKRSRLSTEDAMLLADSMLVESIGITEVAWILPVAAAGAAVYLSIVEGPDLVRQIRRRLKQRKQ